MGSSSGLMAMLVVLGVMSIGWMAVIAVLVTAQKVLPPRAALDVPLALAIFAFGVLMRTNSRFLKLLNEQPAVRENLPLVTAQNASATGTDLDGYFSEGHGVSTFARQGGTVYHCYSSYARGTEFLMG